MTHPRDSGHGSRHPGRRREARHEGVPTPVPGPREVRHLR
jgi:hypothetical protein